MVQLVSGSRHAAREAGAWTLETVDAAGNTGWFGALAIDGADALHVAYYESTAQDLKYATNASGEWVNETVDTSITAAGLGIAVDADGAAHIAYFENGWGGVGDLRYASNASGAWVVGDIDTVTGYGADIAIDDEGAIHIVTGSAIHYVVVLSPPDGKDTDCDGFVW